jgi:sugar phosphate permease
VAYISGKYGWNALFQLFVFVALIAAFLLILKWNYGKENQKIVIENSINATSELSIDLK